MKASNIGIIIVLVFMGFVANAFHGQYVKAVAEQTKMDDYFQCKQSYMAAHQGDESKAIDACMK